MGVVSPLSMRVISYIALACLLACCVQWASCQLAYHHVHGPTYNKMPLVRCLTEDHFVGREGRLVRNCTQRGQCDDPAVRDLEGSSNTPVVIRTAVHVMNSATGHGPDNVGPVQVTTLLNRLQRAFGPAGVQFQSEVFYHNDPTYYCIPGYKNDGAWYDAIEGMKSKYASGVGNTLNIFISCQDVSWQGTLFGIGTFPWDTNALTALGGLWLNGLAVNVTAQLEKDTTVEHEMGHCLGLWHTFHGDPEVPGCKFACEELPHGTLDFNANYYGDFCADPPATPRTYECEDPAGTACNGQPWGVTDFTNYMGYGMNPEGCGNHFTPQQRMRMRCWICDALSAFAVSGC